MIYFHSQVGKKNIQKKNENENGFFTAAVCCLIYKVSWDVNINNDQQNVNVQHMFEYVFVYIS